MVEGEQTKRPHYHLLIFGWSPDADDIYTVDRNGRINENKFGHKYYYSHLIDKVWDFGSHTIGDFTWETASYVARYTTKKVGKLDKDFYEKYNIAPEFIVMSRKPGIGKNWIDNHKECYATFSDNYIGTEFGSRSIGKNRYFDNQLDPEVLSSIKLVRSDLMSRRKKLELIVNHTDYDTLLEKKDEKSKHKEKLLPRKDI